MTFKTYSFWLYCSIFLSFALAPQTVSSAEDAIRIVERTVVSGVETRIGEFYELNADCSPIGDITVKMLKPPKSGLSESEDAVLVTNYDALNQRAACNRKKSQEAILTYRSRVNFRGKDLVEAQIIYPRGIAVKYRFMIEVK